MSLSPLTLQETQRFRNVLLSKNLQPYYLQGQFTPNTSSYSQPITLGYFSVVDSPNTYITNPPFRQQLYPLNNYGPSGGFNLDVRIAYPSQLQSSQPNQGEYNPNETALDLYNETSIDLGYNENRYGPQDGFTSLYFVSNESTNNKIHQPYWEPPTFVPSSYSPIQVLSSNNPTGDLGTLSQDSSMVMIGLKRLKSLFEERINVERIQNTTNFIGLNYKITTPESFILNPTADFSTRLSGSYYPASPIPGNYFNENEKKGAQTNQTSKALSVTNNLLGGLLGPILNLKRNPSQLFLANTGSGQKSLLFGNINFNQYQPDYNRFRGGLTGLLTTIGRSLLSSFDNVENGYYVGSSKREPSLLNSPRDKVPVNEFGKQTLAPVFGPTDLSNLYEGNETKLNFGLGGKAFSEGGGIDGQFVWVSPKYKNNAGFRATPGGGSGKKDQEFFQVESQFRRSESTNVSLKKGSILDDTQRIVDSGDKVSGGARLKHVGNAINQVSKVFNDGYKEMTRGSKVLSYIDNATGREEGIEYARVFTKDTPYYTYNDLQKKDGITTSGRRFTSSVLDNTYNLNIAPMRGSDSTNIKINNNGTKSVKKYMFSIENLAWRTSSRPGFRYEDLPDCEKGPNGGRIMWFPPYDIKFSDSSSPSFQATSFLGRPEPMYTYKETSRSGTLSWKILVDHPSILNVIIRKQLKGVKKEKIDSIIDSFFAGAMKYDIYELAKRFGQIPTKVVESVVLGLQNAKNEDDVNKTEKEIEKGPDGNANTAINRDTQLNTLKSEFLGIGFYFPNQYAKNDKYEDVISKYSSDSNKDADFFSNVIQPNFDSINSNFIPQLTSFLQQNDGTLTIVLEGGIQNFGGVPTLFVTSQRQTAENYLKNNPSLKTFFDNKKLIIKNLPTSYGTTTPNAGGSRGFSFNCADRITGSTVGLNLLKTTACRRVLFQNFTFIPKNQTTPPPIVNSVQSGDQVKPKDNTTALEEFKAGISKKILRNLLTECDYFDMIKEDTPMIYDSIKEKIKFFDPTFHSMTPEGLNSRLVFLNQCVRPGETIPVIGVKGEPVQNNALNTSFGAPPILVLRIGDFYHTKIVPTSLSFSYDPLQLDMNPEGIGVQPMIASVSLNFNIIGGMGLEKPVEQLQNALSFSYYANTEIYDERATVTDTSFEKIDKALYESIRNRVDTTPSPVQDQTNRGGNTIGEILSTTTTTGGETGDINYKKIMNSLLTQTSNYFESVVNKLESVQDKNNFGVVQILNYQRDFSNGTIQKSPFNPGNVDTIEIFGKPSGWDVSIDNLITRVKEGIDDNTNPIIDFLAKFFTVNDDSFPIRDVKKNMKEYIDGIATDFKNPIAVEIQELTQLQQTYVQTIRKLNVVVDKTDGNINDRGVPKVYNISGTAYNTLVDDFGKLKVAMDRYVELLKDGSNPIAFYQTNSEVISLVNKNKFNTSVKTDFFVLMARILTDKDKKEDFVNFVIKNELLTVKRPVNLKNKFEKIVDDLEDIYKDELKEEKNLFQKLKKRQQYKNLTRGLSKIMYKSDVERKCGYTTVKNDNIIAQQETLIKNLYASVNSNEDTETFDGKLVFK